MSFIDFDANGCSLGRITRRDFAYDGITLHSGYTLNNGNIEKSPEKVFHDLHLVLPPLEEAWNESLTFIIEEPVFSAATKLLDTTAYQNMEEEDLVEHLKEPLEANGFIETRLRLFLLLLFVKLVLWRWFLENIF